MVRDRRASAIALPPRGARAVARRPGVRGLPLMAVRRHLPPILATLAGASVVALLIYGVSTQQASRTLDQAVSKGRRPAAPDATRSLPVLGGRSDTSLASFRGKVVVLNFWAS